MTKILTLIVIYLFGNIDASNDSFVFTPKMAQSCKEHMCTDGYTYTTVYMVDSDEMREIKRDTDMAFEMHIAIQAMSNGHILLSSVPRPVNTDRVYEFVVGGGGNRFTELRGHLKRDAKASVKTEKILSTFELRGFYIKISQDGLIEFGKEGEILPLISYNDIDPIEIKYFSFAAWSGVEAKFLYDCPVPLANGSAITGDSEEIDRPLSVTDQLKRDLLKYRLPWLSPTPTMDVRLGVKITSVKYNAFQSKLETGVSIVVSWIDDSLAWYPAKYNGTKRLKFRQGQIWSPKFYVFNSDDQQVLAGRNSELISMESTGEATYHFQTKVNTWCIDSPEEVNKWPHDEYDCSVLIQPWDVHEKITIINMDATDKKMKIFSDIDPEIKNEWEATTKQMMVIKPSFWNKVYETDDITTQQSDRLFINIQVKRSAKPYNIVFYTPLLVLMTFVLLSFWSEPLTMNRVWFLAGCTIVICMGLCYVDYLVPCHSLPSILVLYTVVLGGVLTALLTQVLLMTKVMNKVCSSSIMQRVFTCRIFRIIFCLPAFKFQMPVNGNYILQEDDEPIAERGSDVEEMEREKESTYCDKKELAEVMDKILFVTYSVTFAALLAAHF